MTRKEAIFFFENRIAFIQKRLGTVDEKISEAANGRIFLNDRDEIKACTWAIKFIQLSIDWDEEMAENSPEDIKERLQSWRVLARKEHTIRTKVVHHLLNYINELHKQLKNPMGDV